MSGQKKASEDHRPRSKLLYRALYLRPTYDKLQYVCPAALSFMIRQGGKKAKRGGTHVNALTVSVKKWRENLNWFSLKPNYFNQLSNKVGS